MSELEPGKNGGFLTKVLGLSLAFFFAAGAFVSGFQLGHDQLFQNQQASIFSWFTNSADETPPDEVDLSEFWRVWNLLEEKFAAASSTDPLSAEERIQGAIEGLVDAYDDPYTVYLPPVDAALFDEDISGNFSGVGMEIGLRDGLITIIAPLPDTPAQQAGLLAGDVIVRIDDVATEDMRIDEAVRIIRGEKGTIVELVIYRTGETEFKTIAVTRDTISIPTVKTEMIEDTFIISLYSFNAISEDKMRMAIREYTASGKEKLIVDVRGNPGGYLQSAVAIASYFLPSGTVVVREQSTLFDEEKLFRSRNVQVKTFTPNELVILVDGGSASASEILAGALKDHGVATVIGTPTFGKGSVQELVELDSDASLKVTVARWLTPDGVSISNGGLQPDIIITRTAQDQIDEVDPQKDAALRFLKGEAIASEDLASDLTFEEIGG